MVLEKLCMKEAIVVKSVQPYDSFGKKLAF